MLGLPGPQERREEGGGEGRRAWLQGRRRCARRRQVRQGRPHQVQVRRAGV